MRHRWRYGEDGHKVECLKCGMRVWTYPSGQVSCYAPKGVRYGGARGATKGKVPPCPGQ